MQRAKRARAVFRSSFMKEYENIVSSLSKFTPMELKAGFSLLEQKYEEICVLNHDIFDLLLDNSDVSEEDLALECNEADEYSKKFRLLREEVSRMLEKKYSNDAVSTSSMHKFKWPRFELKRFNGDLRDWIHFWGLFQKIDEDQDLDNVEKFNFLLQSTEPDSRARRVVESFPPSAENYPKAVDALKNRFAREDLLIEMYIRELLNLVTISNVPLPVLYDKLECQIRSLESLGVTTDKCSSMLYPLVESCLPEEILRVWQRSSSSSLDKSKDKLDSLLLFIRSEVENEEKISMAVAGIGSSKYTNKKRSFEKTNGSKTECIPTAAGLLTTNNKLYCIFCSSDNHKSFKCLSAQKLSYDDKKQILFQRRCCFICLVPGHSAKKCKFRGIKCFKCEKRHYVIMCPDSSDQKVENRVENSNQVCDSPSIAREKSLASFSDTKNEVLLQSLSVILRGDNNVERQVRILIDNGSQRSYILKETAAELGYQPETSESIIHSLFGGIDTPVTSHSIYKIHMESLDRQYRCNFSVLDQQIICDSIAVVGPQIHSLQQELNTLGITISDQTSGRIEVLIGADVSGKLLTGEVVQLSSGLTAVNTYLGWTVYGKNPVKGSSVARSSAMAVTTMLISDMQIEDLWNLDQLGIKDPFEFKSSADRSQEILDNFQHTITTEPDGRYVVHLPWIEGRTDDLPTNYDLALCRLESTIKKLKKDDCYDAYEQVFNDWLSEGIIERVQSDVICGHYMPHRHVLKENSTTKIRPVFDASAHTKNSPSLNSCLDKGINFIEKIPSILFKFRLHKYGVIADIRKAFLQIGLKESDQDFLRFLWKDRQGNIIVFRHCRVVFGVTSSPFLLGATIQYHLKKVLERCKQGVSKYSSNFIELLLNSFYVDNCVTSLETKDELERFISESKAVMEEAKFDLRGWESNNIEASESNESVVEFNLLGLVWDRINDTLSVRYECFLNLNLEKITKRLVLSISHKIFDPIGISVAVMLLPKLLLRRMWVDKVGWDDELCDDLKTEFLNWLKDLHYLSEIKIPRCFVCVEREVWLNVSLHTFCDASQFSYAAVSFLRIETASGIFVELVQAKSKIAPVKKISIPRLELLAATIGSRLAKTIFDYFSCHDAIQCWFWSDSSTVLAWINRNENWSVFVRNRVVEILKLSSKNQWRYVPGNLNPADLPSRGCSAKILLKSRWWEGPEWLKLSVDNWPQELDSESFNEKNIADEKIKTVSCNLDLAVSDWNNFSKFSMIVNVIAWIKRFAFNCMNPDNKICGGLSITELNEAELCILKLIQRESFVGYVQNKSIQCLLPYKDEFGLLRVKTKLTYRDDSLDFRHPVVLPAKHILVHKLIRELHENMSHVGVQTLLSHMREKYWVLGGRRTVMSVISKCVRCKRFLSKHLSTGAAFLPEHRVRDASAFEITGVDLAGPLFLKNGQKFWVALFTCAIYRAVHLELVFSLSTDAFLKSFRRFVARRGRPTVVYSDNGTNFVGTANAFQELDWDEIHKKSSIEKIEWKFNPPTAAWWGGWWERLIRLLKDLLRRVLGRASLMYDELLTVLCDCEAVINQRPISFLFDSSQPMCALTPSMFIQDIKEIGVVDCDNIDGTKLNRRAKYRNRLSLDLKKRFRLEYLGELRHRHNQRASRAVRLNEVVLVGGDNVKRINWPLAKVIEIIPGKDGRIRLVKLLTAKGEILRPIQRIFPLEVDSSDFDGSLIKSRVSCTSNERPGIADDAVVPDENEVVRTRSGRIVNKPVRYME